MLSDIQIQELKEVDPQAYNKMRFTNKQLYLDVVAITQDILPDKKTSIIQRIHHVLNNTTEIPLCKTCQEVKVSWNIPGREYRTFCSSSICSSKDEDAAARQLAAAAVTRAENVGPKFIENLTNMKLVLLETFKSSTDIHKMQCQICEHEFESVPRTRVGVFNQHGSNGCPNCVVLARQARSEASRAKAPAKPIKPEVVPYPNRLADIGIKLLVPFTKAKEHHLMQCQTCLHEWSSTPIFNLQSNKKRGGNGCPNCHKLRRTDAEGVAKNKQAYRKDIFYHARKNERNNKDIVNPNHEKLGQHGEEGAYQIDHIFPTQYGYDNNIPAVEISAINNIQVIPWAVNLYHRDIIKGAVSDEFMVYLGDQKGPWNVYNEVRDVLNATPIYHLQARGVFEINNKTVLLIVLDYLNYTPVQIDDQVVNLEMTYSQVVVITETEWRENKQQFIELYNAL